MKLLVLCNDRMALPALNQLIQLGKVGGVGMCARKNEMHAVVKMLCERSKIPFRSFTKAGLSKELADWINEYKPDVVLVKTFPWKIPAEVLAMPRLGFINFHYAPLPEYRGANPLFRMIKDGVKEAGVTVHQMTEQVDEGPVLLRSKIPIHPVMTFGMLCTQLGYNGAELSNKLLPLLELDELKGSVQNNDNAGWYERPKPQELWINWEVMDADTVRRLVNACNPWNKGAATSLNGWTLGLSYASPLQEKSNAAAGIIVTLDEISGLRIACKDGTMLRADVIYTEEGFIPGFALGNFGIRKGMKFN